MVLRALPLLAGIGPIIAIHVSYWVAITQVGLTRCIPYIEGCTSISATGRYPPASFVFKGAMMPDSVILAAYWLLNIAWLRALQRSQAKPVDDGFVIGFLGITGAAFLILYVSFLGSKEPFYEFMRRFGVYVYFAFTVFSQIVLAVKVRKLVLPRSVHRIVNAQLAIALVPFALGILNLVLKATLENADPAENVIEWIFALLMHVYFVLTYFAWRDTGFNAKFAVTT